MRRPGRLGVTLLLALGVAACSGASDHVRGVPPRGDAARGREAITRYGCGSCHTIPGVPGARGLIGPPLAAWAERGFIAGKLPNEPGRLARWIMTPQSIEPGTDMPDMGVRADDARDIAAYLYTLR